MAYFFILNFSNNSTRFAYFTLKAYNILVQSNDYLFKKQIIMKNFIKHCIAILVLLILLYLGINIIQNSRKINNNYQHFKQNTNTLIKKSKQKQKD